MRMACEAAMEANFAAVKGSVQCDQVAEDETTLRGEGKDLRGRCPLPDHQGASRSFYCYDNGSGFYDKWYCHRCSVGGDVIDLYGRMHGLDHNPLFALQALAERFGIKLIKDTDLMSDAQLGARRAKEKAHRAFARAVSRHYFERHVVPLIKEVRDPAERKALLDECLKEAGLT